MRDRFTPLFVVLFLLLQFGCTSPSPSGVHCTRDVDCPIGRFCEANACTLECAFDVDCPNHATGAHCDPRGHCVATQDGGTDVTDSSVTICTSNVQCDDLVFCNGTEHCAPGMTGADSHGCVAGSGSPCVANQMCIESTRMCMTNCAVAPDADGDGAIAMACGGPDCDDSDPNRFPGNPEVCVLSDPTHDEDCSPDTFGRRDADGDGFPDARCCNASTTGMNCGSDCDDTRADVAPGRPEACDGIDNNCDGMIDEGVQHTYYRDADGDGYGDPGQPAMHACSPPAMYVENNRDCAPADPNRNPGVGETRCDGLDDNCDGRVDEGLAGVACQSGLPGACAQGTTTCTPVGGVTCTPTMMPSCPSAGTVRPCNACDLQTTQTCDGCTYPGCSLTAGGVLNNWTPGDAPWTHTGTLNGSFLTGGTLRGPGWQLPLGTYDMYFEGLDITSTTFSATGADMNISGIGVGDTSGTHTIRIRIDTNNCASHLVYFQAANVGNIYLMRLSRVPGG